MAARASPTCPANSPFQEVGMLLAAAESTWRSHPYNGPSSTPKKAAQTTIEASGKRHSSFGVGSAEYLHHESFQPSRRLLIRRLPRAKSCQVLTGNPDFVSLSRGGSNGRRGMLSGKAIATQIHPRNEDTIVAAQQPVKPMRAPINSAESTQSGTLQLWVMTRTRHRRP